MAILIVYNNMKSTTTLLLLAALSSRGQGRGQPVVVVAGAAAVRRNQANQEEEAGTRRHNYNPHSSSIHRRNDEFHAGHTRSSAAFRRRRRSRSRRRSRQGLQVEKHAIDGPSYRDGEGPASHRNRSFLGGGSSSSNNRILLPLEPVGRTRKHKKDKDGSQSKSSQSSQSIAAAISDTTTIARTIMHILKDRKHVTGGSDKSRGLYPDQLFDRIWEDFDLSKGGGEMKKAFTKVFNQALDKLVTKGAIRINKHGKVKLVVSMDSSRSRSSRRSSSSSDSGKESKDRDKKDKEDENKEDKRKDKKDNNKKKKDAADDDGSSDGQDDDDTYGGGRPNSDTNMDDIDADIDYSAVDADDADGEEEQRDKEQQGLPANGSTIVHDQGGGNQDDEKYQNEIIDSDGDGVSDQTEIEEGADPYDPHNTPIFIDSDRDGHSDVEEIMNGSDPYDPNDVPDIDSDGSDSNDPNDVPPSGMVDEPSATDGDFVSNAAETDPNDPNGIPPDDDIQHDLDGDGFSNFDEIMSGTDPKDPNDVPNTDALIDSDGDGFSNAEEYEAGSNPFDPNDVPPTNTDPNAGSNGNGADKIDGDAGDTSSGNENSVELGGPCQQDEQCITNVCVQGTCTNIRSVDESCDSDTDCAIGICGPYFIDTDWAGKVYTPTSDGLEGKCTTVEVGGPCKQNEDCTTKVCIDFTCINIRNAGESCESDLHCSNGVCGKHFIDTGSGAKVCCRTEERSDGRCTVTSAETEEIRGGPTCDTGCIAGVTTASVVAVIAIIVIVANKGEKEVGEDYVPIDGDEDSGLDSSSTDIGQGEGVEPFVDEGEVYDGGDDADFIADNDTEDYGDHIGSSDFPPEDGADIREEEEIMEGGGIVGIDNGVDTGEEAILDDANEENENWE